MLFLQIRQAEIAVADGRLDEAYQLLARSDELRSHRRGQALATTLVKALSSRAEAHLGGGRAGQALLDCDKAQTLGGNLPDVLDLRSRIEQAIISTDRARREHAQAAVVENAAQLVDAAMGRKDLDRAVSELVRARGRGITDTRIREFDADIRGTLADQLSGAIDAGRFDQAGPLLDRLERVDPEGMETRQMARAIEQAREAWSAVARGRAYDAQEILHRLAVQLPNARWIVEALSHLDSAEQSLRAVRTGPLGLMMMEEPPAREPQRAAAPRTPPPLPNGADGQLLPMKFVIQVDGAGSYLVLRQSRVTIGPISSSKSPDIALIADAGAAIVSLERVEDDYFQRGGAPGSASKLLASGDRIALSPRCRLNFAIPNPSSTSAVLDLSAGRFPRADLRRVILLDRDLIIGPGNSAHIRADQLTDPVALHVRDGRLWCRNQQIPMGVATNISGISIVATMS